MILGLGSIAPLISQGHSYPHKLVSKAQSTGAVGSAGYRAALKPDTPRNLTAASHFSADVRSIARRKILPQAVSSRPLKLAPAAYDRQGAEIAPGEVLIRLKPGMNLSAAFLSRYKVAVGRYIGGGADLMKIEDSRSVDQEISELKKDGSVVYAEPNYIRHAAVIPNDPYFSADIPGYSGTKQWGPQKISAPQGWDITTGTTSTIVAVVDTGVDYNHSELSGKVIKGSDYVNLDSDPMDDNGHGTHVAGIIAAKTNNSSGIAGISWNSQILAIKVLDASGSGWDSDVASGISEAADRGAKVINLSLAGTQFSQTLQDAVTYAFNHGALVVAAAGNDGNTTMNYPAGCTNAMGVASTGQSDVVSSFSTHNSSVDAAAPGENILSTYSESAAPDPYATVFPGYYADLSGTSMATPHVAGLATLLFGIHPDWTPLQVEQRIESTADDKGAAGRDDYYGWGRINMYRALLYPVSIGNLSVSPSTFDPTGGGQLSVNFTLSTSANVFLSIIDGSGALKRKIGPIAKLGGSNTLLWDGKDNNGQLLPPFWYRIALYASDGSTSSSQNTTANLSYGSPLSISVPSANPSTFTSGSGTTFSADCSRAAFIGVAIYDSAYSQVRVLPFENRQSGPNSFIWDGKDGSGLFAPAGLYNYIIFGRDSGGNAASASGSFTVR